MINDVCIDLFDKQRITKSLGSLQITLVQIFLTQSRVVADGVIGKRQRVPRDW